MREGSWTSISVMRKTTSERFVNIIRKQQPASSPVKKLESQAPRKQPTTVRKNSTTNHLSHRHRVARKSSSFEQKSDSFRPTKPSHGNPQENRSSAPWTVVHSARYFTFSTTEYHTVPYHRVSYATPPSCTAKIQFSRQAPGRTYNWT